MFAFEGIGQPDPLELLEARRSLGYHRLNAHYREAHELAWSVFEAFGISDLFRATGHRCFAFLIDMDRLFELFVYRCFECLFPDRSHRIRYQVSDGTILWDVSADRPHSRVRPDLLLETVERPTRRLPVDAKYKLYDQGRVSNEDLYQTFLYAYAFSTGHAEGLPAALLVHPHSGGSLDAREIVVRTLGGLSGARIFVQAIDIPGILDAVRTGNTETWKARLGRFLDPEARSRLEA